MKSTGTFIGGILLIAGSCIGAGMLALPIMTGLSGFFPSLVMFLIAWGFMTITGLLMVEVNSSFDARVNIGSMAERAFGKTGRYLSWILYLFLFYSLLVAYISGSGSLSSTYFLTIILVLLVVLSCSIAEGSNHAYSSDSSFRVILSPSGLIR